MEDNFINNNAKTRTKCHILPQYEWLSEALFLTSLNYSSPDAFVKMKSNLQHIEREAIVEWFQVHCSLASNKIGNSITELYVILKEHLNDDSRDNLESGLLDIFGFQNFDFISSVLVNKSIILGFLEKIKVQPKHNCNYQQRVGGNDFNYPHIYGRVNTRNILDEFGHKFVLSKGSTCVDGPIYQELTIPFAEKAPSLPNEKLIQVKDLDILCRNAFRSYQCLNRIQSLVFSTAYDTNENMLICAPTSTGKTDIALIAILKVIKSYGLLGNFEDLETPTSVDLSALKIVYIAPMKALAAEIVSKYQSKLAWIDIAVREFTGDMQLTRREIESTQIFVTTPEKWDVLTRKTTNEESLVSKVKLMIIDEIHILHDDRGSVIESIVARTFRYLEASQRMIRVVALSATLPNFLDVADFLKVNREVGLYYFSSSFRPCPIEQHFIGTKGKAGTTTSQNNIDIACGEKVVQILGKSKQVIVFVHSRKDTIKTCQYLKEFLKEATIRDFLDPKKMDGYSLIQKEVGKSRNKDFRELFEYGIGFHNAGMLRSDRKLVEKLFTSGYLKAICCTATLAWGVNLPAFAVIIKGTQYYNPETSSFTDLGISDVLQCFGRAGRPQYEDFAVAYLITTSDKFQHYVRTITQQIPIESKMMSKLVDNLNAEVALGTVSSVNEAISWLSFSFLFIRMQRNPMAYGIDLENLKDDPNLSVKCHELITEAAKTLAKYQMIVYNPKHKTLLIKDFGRIASNFYISHKTIASVNANLKRQMTELEIIELLGKCEELSQIKSKPNESMEVKHLWKKFYRNKSANGKFETASKASILLHAYLGRACIDDLGLFSEMLYIQNNISRISRAIFEIALSRKLGSSYQCLNLCKAIEKRVWFHDSPIKQFDLPPSISEKFQNNLIKRSIEELKEMTKSEISSLTHNNKLVNLIYDLVQSIPILIFKIECIPLTKHILRIVVNYKLSIKWNKFVNGVIEPIWIWIEDLSQGKLIYSDLLVLKSQDAEQEKELTILLPIENPIPVQLFIRAISDNWIGAESIQPISFNLINLPLDTNYATDLLDLHPLPIEALHNEEYEKICSKRFHFFNAMQAQIFFSAYNTSLNLLIGAPTGSGKTMIAELAIFREFSREKSIIVYIAPMKALVNERVNDWRNRLAIPLKKNLVEFTGDTNISQNVLNSADMIITTPEKWDAASRRWKYLSYVQRVSLIIMDEIHLLGSDRGSILEMIVSRANRMSLILKKKVRFLGLSTAMANAHDVSEWLNVPRTHLYNFRHSVRPVPLEIYIDSFSSKAYCPRMAQMNKPTFQVIRKHASDKPAIVFVSSRRQTRLTAQALISLCATEDNPKMFFHMNTKELNQILETIVDEDLKFALSFGIGLHHAGLVDSDRRTSESLFVQQKIQILVATSTLAWGINTPAHLVVVKGTEFYDAKIGGYRDMDLTDILQMLGRAGRPQFDTTGIARLFVQDTKKSFFKQFLHVGFPIESHLYENLDDHLNAEIVIGSIKNIIDCIEYLSTTFLYKRLKSNPMMYGLTSSKDKEIRKYLIELISKTLQNLSITGCVRMYPDSSIEPTRIAEICSFYYISHLTIRNMIERFKKFNFCDCLRVLCEAKEFDGLSVRHNEDVINIELLKVLRFNVSPIDKPMNDPHVKAFILLQCYFEGIKFPISDYSVDLNSVLEQSLRVLQACMDICAELGDFENLQQFLTVIRCIKLGCWPERLLDYDSQEYSDALPKVKVDIEKVNNQAQVSLQRMNNPLYPDCGLVIKRFPRTQIEGWIAIFCDQNKNIIAVKKFGGYKSKRLAKVFLDIPESYMDSRLILDIESDCYNINFEAEI